MCANGMIYSPVEIVFNSYLINHLLHITWIPNYFELIESSRASRDLALKELPITVWFFSNRGNTHVQFLNIYIRRCRGRLGHVTCRPTPRSDRITKDNKCLFVLYL